MRYLRSFPPHAMVRPARRAEADVGADPVERTLSRVVAAEIPHMPNSPIEKIFSWTGSTELSSRALTDRILSQSLVAEPGRGGRESSPEMDSAQGRRDDFSEESTANSADKSDADWEDEENPTLSVLTEAKFDFAEAQRCRPSKDRSDYLERTGVSYEAYRIVRDLTEQLQQREPSSSSSNQVVVTETPKLLDQPVTYKTIKNFENYITRHRQQDQIGVRNAGITSQAKLLIGPRINGWAQNHPNSSEKAELEQTHMAWLGWKHDKFFAILIEVFSNLPGRAQAGGYTQFLQAKSAVVLGRVLS